MRSNRAGGATVGGAVLSARLWRSGQQGAARSSVEEVNCSGRLKRSGHCSLLTDVFANLRSEERLALIW
ncbi:hypothetical protein ACOSP7_004834 [Xanthoceras sorbifolium]